MLRLFGSALVELMGRGASDRAPCAEALGALEESLRLVLEHLERVKPGASAAFSSIRCVEGLGIVLEAPASVPGARRVRLSPLVAALVEGGPEEEQVMDVLRDEYEWDEDEEHALSVGQGDLAAGVVFRIYIVSSAPGPEHKHLRYTARTAAELARFLDYVLETSVWDSICAARA